MMQEYLKKHRQTKTKQLEQIVNAALKANEADYKLVNIAYIWLIRDFNKKSLPDGRWSGIIYETDTSHNIRSGCIIVYATCEDQDGWADDCEVVTMWTNPKHAKVDNIVIPPREVTVTTKDKKVRKKNNRVKFEDVMEKFFELRDNPEMGINESAAALSISYSKYFKWFKQYEHHTIDSFLTIR